MIKEHLYNNVFDIIYLLSGIMLLLTILALLVYKTKNNFLLVLYLSLFSLIITIAYLLMDAPDVAMTEAALGAALSNAILLRFIKLIKTDDNNEPDGLKFFKVMQLILGISIIVVLSISCYDLARYGQVSNVHNGISKYYIENTQNEINIPCFVSAILASYRGYDTLGETTVILVAGLSVLLILSNKK